VTRRDRDTLPHTVIRRLDEFLGAVVGRMRQQGIVNAPRVLEALVHSAVAQAPAAEVAEAYGDAAPFYSDARVVCGLFDGLLPDLPEQIRQSLFLIEMAGP
jgi:hypothetical protein